MKKPLYVLLSLVILVSICYALQPLTKKANSESSYQLVKNWPKLPSEVQLGNPTGIGIDSNQNIVVFHRASRKWPLLAAMPTSPIPEKTILVIHPNTGKLIRSWGENRFIMPHGLTVDHQNNIWITDVGLNQVFKFDDKGTILLTLGVAGEKGNDSLHFDKPTDIAVAKDGSFYVSDGYGNSRIIKFSASGKFLFQWGKRGKKAGEFQIPHALSLDEKENVYVADRENNRIQIFSPAGKFIREITDNSYAAMCSIAFEKNHAKLYAVDDFSFLKLKHRGSDVFIFNKSQQLQERFGRSGNYTGNKSWYHDLAVDKDENIYIGDILGNTIQKFEKIKP